MAVGGMKTLWLFPDELDEKKTYEARVVGQGTHTGKNGKQVPYVVLVGDFGKGVQEYQLCEWRIQSKEKFEPSGNIDFRIERRGQSDLLFTPLRPPQ